MANWRAFTYYLSADGRMHRAIPRDNRAWCHASHVLSKMDGPYDAPPAHATRPCGWCFVGEFVPGPVRRYTGTGWPNSRAT